MEIKVKKLNERAIIPSYQSSGAGCFDLHAVIEGYDKWLQKIDNTQIIGTGLAFEIPEDHVMLIFSRSGHGFNGNIRLANCVGVIDSDYRGEVMVKLTLDGQASFRIKQGDRIAQAMIIPKPQVTFEIVQELSKTERGANGTGSTGV